MSRVEGTACTKSHGREEQEYKLLKNYSHGEIANHIPSPWTEEEGKIMPDPSHRGQGIFSEMTSERCCLIHGLMQCLLNFATGDFKHMLFY